MAVSLTLKQYLDDAGVDYVLELHPYEVVSTRIAQRAHVNGDRLAKGVLVKSDHGYMLALVPSTRHVDLASLSHITGDRLGLAGEEEIERVFADCEPGAIPACGEAFGVRCLIDHSLTDIDDIYFEAGDHVSLVHMRGADFIRLMKKARHASISTAH